MSIKLVELVNSVEALNKLSETKLPASVAFSLGKFLKEITPDVETYNKVKGAKASEYGTPVLDKDGKLTDQVSFVKDGKVTEGGQKFVSEMKEIEEKEITVNLPEIKVKDLGDAILEPKHFVSLAWLIKE